VRGVPPRGLLAITRAGGADAIDARLHAERLGARPAVVPEKQPDGAFVLHDGEPWLVRDGRLLHWTPAGYDRRSAPPATAELITPPTLVDVLRTGWDPLVPLHHPSAD
jgi:hypothetical protein